MNEMKKMLKDVKIVEMGSYIAVPIATRIMAEWGAEVIKVEGTRGDDMRFFGTTYNLPIDPDENAVFSSLNMNKDCICVNLRTPEGVEIVKNLIKDADIFVTNTRLKSLKKYGLDYESVAALKPELVYGYFTGFGTKGKDAARPGYDSTAFWARGGLVDWSSAGDHPVWGAAGMGDTVSGSMFALGLLAALYASKQTGRGTYMENSLYGNAIWYNQVSVIATGEPYNESLYVKDKYTKPCNPLIYSYHTKDGEWITIYFGIYETGYVRLLKTLGLEQYIGDERYSTMEAINRSRENAVTITAIIQAEFDKYDADEMCRILENSDLPFERMRHFSEMSRDPQAIENGYIRDMTFSNGVQVPLPDLPVKFSSYEGSKWNEPGNLGHATIKCLQKLGYSKEEIGNLLKKGAIVAET